MTGKDTAPLSVEEARNRILSLLSVLPVVPVKLEDSLGLTLGQDVVARESHPTDDTSAMDGYAVRASDLRSASLERPVRLPFHYEVAAGSPLEREVTAGQAVRINTGGLIPRGTDAVVMREEVTLLDSNIVEFRAPVSQGSHIRFAGEHVTQGETVLGRGTLLRPAHLSMGAYLGVETWNCVPRPRVAILATGSELVSGTDQLDKGQVRDSNSVGLAAALTSLGANVVSKETVPDSPASLEAALERAFDCSDVLLTTGGISAGWHDHVRNSIEKHDGEFLFHKLKMRPGKPLGFGRCRDTIFFCLPGNPVSSLVTFELFVTPALHTMMGRLWRPTVETATLTEPISKKSGVAVFYRGVRHEVEGRPEVRLTGPQGSHMLRSLAEANVLIWADEKDENLEAGQEVRVIPYNRLT